MTSSDITRTTRLLQRARRGDRRAAAELFPLVYDELRRLASVYMKRERPDHTLQPTAVVHEAYLRLVQDKRVSWKDRGHFLGIAARTMRQILVEHARRSGAQKRGGSRLRVTLRDVAAPRVDREVDLLTLEDALDELQSLHERKVRVVELRFYAGLTNQEAAESLGVSVKTVESDWFAARAWLRGKLRDL